MDIYRLRAGRKRGLSSVIGGVLLFGMIFSTGFAFFYIVGQDQLFYQQAIKSNNALVAQQTAEHILVYGIASNGNLGFYVNNTGIPVSIISYWIFNGTNSVLLQYKNATSLPGILPYYLGVGQSWVVSSTGILVSSTTQRFVIKVSTARGTIAIGTYPSNLVTSAAVNSLVAGGFGSLQMVFTSFTWYDYKSGPVAQSSQSISWDQGCQYGQGCTTYFNNMCANAVQCNGGAWIVDMAHPHPGSLTPEGFQQYCQVGGGNNWWNQYENCYYDQVPMVLAVNITNDDPGLANIVLNSESNLWITETCDFGSTEGNCPNGNPVFVFYAVNVNPSTGAITSLNQGSFSQITLPYGSTKTLYYASAYDISLSAFNSMALTSYNPSGQQQSYYGQFAVFLLFSGTKITQQSIQQYGQNIPFESTTAADNIASYSETPMTCTANQQSSFQLIVNDSVFSNTNGAISKVVLNASAFTVGTPLPSGPTGWTGSLSNGIITWSSSQNKYNIKPGSSLTFSWKGTPPSGASGTQLILPLTIFWSGANETIVTYSAAEVCND